MQKTLFFILLQTLLFISYAQQCCVQFSNRKCIACPEGMHLYRANCIFNIPNCQIHNGFSCEKCNQGYQLNSSMKACDKVIQANPTNEIPSIIMDASIGKTQLTDGQLKQQAFISIDEFIRNAYSSDLPDAVLIAAFRKRIGFAYEYQVFYYPNQSSNVIFQVQINYDLFRSRIIPRGINRLGF